MTFINKNNDFFIVEKQVARGLKINKKSALIGLLILIVAVKSDEFVIFRRNIIGISDIINLI
jgi:hypothetical protein